MKLSDILYKTPEMTEERLLNLIKQNHHFVKRETLRRIQELHLSLNIENAILYEWDLIQSKQSLLSRSQREQVLSLVSVCLIEMTKNNEQVVQEA